MANAANPSTPFQNPDPGSPLPSRLAILPRVIMLTFGITGITFAVCLFLSILSMAAVGIFRGHLPDMRLAYRLVALPVAAVVGVCAFVGAWIVEIREFRRAKLLNQNRLETNR